jgi:TRAP-type C4-dicarboxylate transport system permease small subunit
VQCNSPSLDIDGSKAFRTSLLEERGLGAAWWSYPALVLAFFLLLDRTSSSLNGVHQASWASAVATGLPWPQAVLGLSLGCAGSLLFFWLLQRAWVSLQRTRLLATISAIWIVFWFSDPTLGLWGGWPYRLLQLLVALVSLRWLLWGWSREESS